MDAINDDDAAMMAMMGLTGFGTTKVWELCQFGA